MIDQRRTHAAAVDELLDRLVREQAMNRILERALTDVVTGGCRHEGMVESLRALHTPLSIRNPICFECNVLSPCRTLLLLTAPIIDGQKRSKNTEEDE